jgi:hypothetical protein
MKTSRSTNNKQSKQGNSHKPRPEIRDDLDSRKQKEATQVELRPKGGKRKEDGGKKL